MAVVIINLLETIQVNKHHCRHLLLASCLGERMLKPILAKTQAGQTGQGSVIGQKIELRGNFFPLADFILELFYRIGQFTGAAFHHRF